MIDPETKRKGIENAVKATVIIGGLALAAPVLWMALEGAILLVSLGAVGLVCWGAAPALATWVANKRIQALVAVIEANPIETMQNLYAEKSAELNKAADNIRDFETELGNFASQVKEVKRQEDISDEDIQDYVEVQERMATLLKEMKQEQTSATQELSEFARRIRKGQTLFNLAKAANKMLEKSASAQSVVFAQIKEQVAFDKVRTDLNRAFANLNSAVDRRKNATMFAAPVKPVAALPPIQEGEVIDLTKAGQKITIRK
jgi:flagellar motility protein MotE (MotC chaperone)